MSELSGGCACGQIRYTAEGDPALVANCHCQDCQRAGGSQMATVVAFAKGGFKVSGQPKGYDYTADSGNKLTRFFCPTCGSRLYTNADAMADLALVAAGSLDDASSCKPMMNIFCASAQPWAAIDGSLPKFDGMPS